MVVFEGRLKWDRRVGEKKMVVSEEVEEGFAVSRR